ncbi:MAG: DUF89 domain-containing protein [Candidatus Bathyarchaeia archaeon]
MKVEVECADCILHRGLFEIAEATDDSSLQFKVASALFQLLAKEFKPTAVPAYLGTERDRLIKRMTGNPDPYAKKKQSSNRKALEFLPLAEKLVSKESSPERRFRKACLCSIVGNVMEFDIPGHTFKYEDIGRLVQRAEDDLAIDDIAEIFDAVEAARRILYLADNAGEIVFDKLLVGELKKLGAHVIVAVKGGPVINDATMEDAKYVGMEKIADDVITTGTDAVGLMPEQCSREFLKVYDSVDLVLAKGMGYVETLTELDLASPHVLLLRTKCQPVANFLNIEKGKNVAKLMF